MEQNLSSAQVQERLSQLEDELRPLHQELAELRSRQLIEALLLRDGPLPRENKVVVRTARGLTVKGTRLTLYSIMDEIKDTNSFKNIRDIYELTDEEMLEVLDYLHLHRAEVEAEYREVVRHAEENKQYWEERNRERFAKLAPQQELVRARLKEWRAQYHAKSDV
jgi:uncharacterized protein (DUF433 family)